MKIGMRVYMDGEKQIPLGFSFSNDENWEKIENHIIATFDELCGVDNFIIPVSGLAVPSYKKFANRMKLKIYEN